MEVADMWSSVLYPVEYVGSYISTFIFDCKPSSDAELGVITRLQEKLTTNFTWEANETELRELHSLLKVGDFERTGPSWRSAGFQQRDPVSDVRGGGCLAVENLSFFLEKLPHVAIPMCRMRGENRESGANYPWAAASISVTRMLAAEFGLIHPTTGKPTPREQLPWATKYHLLAEDPQAFQKLFVLVFLLLDHEFSAQQATYMEFPSVLEATRVRWAALLASAPTVTVRGLANAVGETVQTSALEEL